MVLTRVLPAFLYQQFGLDVTMPQHEGDTSKWRRWSNLADQLTPLTEGEDPTPLLLSKTDITAILKEFGALIKTASWRDFTGLTDDNQQMANVLLDNMRSTLDSLARDVLDGGASSTTCSNGTPTATFLNKTDIDIVVTNLEGQNSMKFKPTIPASTSISTSPIRAAYVGIGDTDQRPRLEAVSGFKHVSSYSNQGPIMEHEFGSTGDVRWLLTTKAPVSSGSYSNIIMAKEFFGNVKIKGNTADGPLVFTPADRTGSGLRRFSLLGWIQNYAARILNDNFGHNLISTV
jgi:N4-gp56 family major capsid protein